MSTTLEFPKNFMAAYLGTYVSRVDDGGLEFRGDRGTLKIDRTRLAFYRDDAPYAPGTLTPEPEIFVRSSGDGTLTHLQNWLDCIRSRKTPNANIRVAHQAARTSHIANAALRAGNRCAGTTQRRRSRADGWADGADGADVRWLRVASSRASRAKRAALVVSSEVRRKDLSETSRPSFLSRARWYLTHGASAARPPSSRLTFQIQPHAKHDAARIDEHRANAEGLGG